MNLTIIRENWAYERTDLMGSIIELKVERHILAKRRWNAKAEDGREFGFDLERPLKDGAVFYREDSQFYRISQLLESVLIIPFVNTLNATRVAWSIGNLHFPIEINETTIIVLDDLAIRQYLNRDQVSFERAERVFQPARAMSQSHGHTNGH